MDKAGWEIEELAVVRALLCPCVVITCNLDSTPELAVVRALRGLRDDDAFPPLPREEVGLVL